MKRSEMPFAGQNRLRWPKKPCTAWTGVRSPGWRWLTGPAYHSHVSTSTDKNNTEINSIHTAYFVTSTCALMHFSFAFSVFSALTLLVESQEEHPACKIGRWGVDVVICQQWGVCIWFSWCHCHPKTPSSLASFTSRPVLPFRYRLTQVVLEKKPLNGMFFCVHINVSVLSRYWNFSHSIALQ